MTIAGTAGKGVLANAVVTVEEIMGSGAPVSRLSAPVRTGADGSYTLPLSGYTNGPLLLTVSGGTGVTMVCDLAAGCPTPDGPDEDSAPDIVAEGDTLAVGEGFRMRALLPTVNGNSARRCITPQSTLAARRAELLAQSRGGIITSTDARIALATTSSLFGGVDAQRACVLDITDPAVFANASPEDRVASALAAASLAVFTSDGNTDPVQAIAQPLAQVQSETISSASLGMLVEQATTELQMRGEVDETGTLAMIAQTVANAGEGDLALDDFEPDQDVPLAAVDRAKQFTSELRTLANVAQVDFREGGPAQAFADQLDAAANIVDPLGDLGDEGEDNVLGGAVRAFEFGRDVYELRNGQAGQETRTSLNSQGLVQTATITVSSVNTSTDQVRITGNIGDNVVNITGLLPKNADSTASTVMASITGTVETAGTGPGARLSVTNGTLTAMQTADPQLPGEIADSEVSAINGALAARLETLRAPTSSSASFVGGLNFSLVRCPSCVDPDPDPGEEDDVYFNPSGIVLNGTLSAGGSSTNVNLNLAVSNATTFNPDVPLSEENRPLGTVSLSFGLNLSGLPAYSVVVTTTLTGFNDVQNAPTGMVVVRLSRGSQTFTLTATPIDDPSSDDPTDLVARVVATNSAGDSVTIETIGGDTPTVGSIVVDDAVVGSITETDNGLGIIRYEDGTFESL